MKTLYSPSHLRIILSSAYRLQIQREEKADKEIKITTVSQNDGANARPVDADRANKISRSRSRRRGVTDTGQTDNGGKPEIDENTPAAELDRRRNEQALNGQANGFPTNHAHLAPPIVLSSPPDENSENAKAVAMPASPGERPSAGPGKAFPFKLGRHLSNQDVNASTVTLASQAGVVSPKGDEQSKQLGDSITSGPPDQKAENATTVPLPGSRGPGKASPFKLGGNIGDEGAIASQAGAVSPKVDETVKQLGHSRDTQDEHSVQTQVKNNNQETIEPIEDAHGEQTDGVDHYDLRNKLPLEGENDNELASNVVGPAEERRGTLEDAKGVLHHGPGVVGGIGEKKGGGEGGGGKGGDGVHVKPGIDRSDTVSLD